MMVPSHKSQSHLVVYLNLWKRLIWFTAKPMFVTVIHICTLIFWNIGLDFKISLSINTFMENFWYFYKSFSIYFVIRRHIIRSYLSVSYTKSPINISISLPPLRQRSILTLYELWEMERFGGSYLDKNVFSFRHNQNGQYYINSDWVDLTLTEYILSL